MRFYFCSTAMTTHMWLELADFSLQHIVVDGLCSHSKPGLTLALFGLVNIGEHKFPFAFKVVNVLNTFYLLCNMHLAAFVPHLCLCDLWCLSFITFEFHPLSIYFITHLPMSLSHSSQLTFFNPIQRFFSCRNYLFVKQVAKVTCSQQILIW